jgi:CheY-like chemotaxis protein
MGAIARKQGSGTELLALLEMVVDTIGETLSSLVGCQIQVQRGSLLVQEPESVLLALPRKSVVARGAMDKDYAGKSLLTVIEFPDAVAMAGLLMMTPHDVIDQRRKSGTIEEEDVEAFGELGNVLYSGYSNVLREKVDNFDLRMQDQGLIEPGKDAQSILGADRLVTFGFKMKVGEYPESQGIVTIDVETAERWNKGPFEMAAAEAEAAEQEAAPPPPRPDDDGLESIPAAPIRGTLAAFVIQGDVFRTLRRSCRRTGLELRRHGRGEIPNPAAHRNEVVLLDVPPGEERRFDWCRRIKDLSESTKVVLLIHHASRQRVTQAFLSRADAILGFPCDEKTLSQKLDQLVSDQSPVAPPSDEPE